MNNIEYILDLNNNPIIIKSKAKIVDLDDSKIISFEYDLYDNHYLVNINITKDELLIKTSGNDYLTNLYYSKDKAYVNISIANYQDSYEIDIIKYDNKDLYLEYEFIINNEINNNKIILKYID